MKVLVFIGKVLLAIVNIFALGILAGDAPEGCTFTFWQWVAKAACMVFFYIELKIYQKNHPEDYDERV